uniref:uncharacterized protein LOC124065199 isoform X2 n=1 Tax=Scatophagus argus TaxID=75038 RepID=UPI001ED7EA1B|nr:uncharacterized protein LOC124065199 isoform X2 [Scatophagus argus]
MDLRTVMIISTFLLTAESTETSSKPDLNVTAIPTQTNSTNKNCLCLADVPATTSAPIVNTSSPAPTLGLLTVTWTKGCEGDVRLNIYSPSRSSTPVCHTDNKNVWNFLGNVCQTKTGCEGPPNWRKGRRTENSFHIGESGAEMKSSCLTLRVECTVRPDTQGQLQAYKVVTALLCCVLLILLLIRFTRPTVKVLQKRLSDRRQNRWIGPTQSHSVSYHRGKAAVKNNDRETRLSYPALERLAVSDSREPSSNRNSDYNF